MMVGRDRRTHRAYSLGAFFCFDELIGQRPNLVLPGLFKPRSSRPAAAGEEQIPISVEELDRGAIGEAVGAGEMDVGGDYPRSSKGAVFVIDVRYIVERVILTTWLALPETSLGGVERARTGRVGVGGEGAVAVKGH